MIALVNALHSIPLIHSMEMAIVMTGIMV
jgi:hypothetical protein